MNKKLITLAVTSALAASSAVNADSKNVDIYGKLYPQFQVSESTGASAANTAVSHLVDSDGALGGSDGENFTMTNAIETSNSYLGFKGQEDLGGGMKAWFQIENRLRFDTQNGQWSSRNSAVGLSGGFGSVFLGNWDTVYKQLGDPVSFLGVSSGNFVSNSELLSEIGFGANRDAASFHLRQRNYIQYESPEMGGVQVLIGYSPDEREDLNTNARLLSAGVKFEQGPLYLAVAREIHKDFFAITRAVGDTGAEGIGNAIYDDGEVDDLDPNVSSEDTATRFSVMFTFGDTKIGADIANLEFEESGGVTGAFAAYERKNINFVVTQKLGALSLAVNLTKADEGECSRVATVCTTTGLGASFLGLGAKYDLSKRTSLFFLAATIDNDEAASYSLTRDVDPGADSKAIALGISHNI